MFELLPLIKEFGLPVVYLSITIAALRVLYRDSRRDRAEYTQAINRFASKIERVDCLKK